MNKLEDFRKEVEPYIGTLVLTESWSLGKLLDVKDGGDDYYYIIDEGRTGIVWHTCVGRVIGLKGKIDNDDYDHLERVWNLNEPFWKENGITE